MLFRVLGLKWHTVTSTHFPLTQASLWPTRQWGKAIYPPLQEGLEIHCKSSREVSELLRAIMQPTMVYSGQNAYPQGTAFSYTAVFLCIIFFLSKMNHSQFILTWFLHTYKEGKRDAVGSEISENIAICAIYSRLCPGSASFLDILLWKINRCMVHCLCTSLFT